MDNSQRCFRYFSYFTSPNCYNLEDISQLRLWNCTESVTADNRNPLHCKLSFFLLVLLRKNLIFPSCRDFCAARSSTDPISALPLLFSLSMSVMLSRTLNIFTASLSQNSRISSSISQDTLFAFFHRILTLFDSQILFPKPPHSSCSLLLSKCNFFHLIPTKSNSIPHIVPSICGDHFEFCSCPPEHLQALEEAVLLSRSLMK